MILLIDNYDSFSYNVYQLVSSVAEDVRVIRNDDYTPDEIKAMEPKAIILSPGPGKPKDAGVCLDVVQQLRGSIPILGICLGHQAICEAYGGTVGYAKELMHGKQKPIRKTMESKLLKGLQPIFLAARYHSLSAEEATLPKELQVIARSDDADGEVMAVEDAANNVFGVQFHPESVMTPEGKQIIENFMEVIQ
ncbi:MAG: aminodeoxychorismate/anthranilate synthase component II [Lachnospiraceae bacterium]|nr:aminodeoxychorismate/anthranilate synthase component II [Lachnospiraceae bacterium]MBQ1608479.1 aminodeoxychorismate/anthranilate synthase component II [Lachnospiraceae bacterium]MBQ1640400.1 aminodeoxychorismate/anthranilate synthase component II [Lachnospiraceae bacterium]MBQ1720508.1 aminodeoxychorismate/anthranilate synthase component II [Lachnospiraceae bacterium]MBQ2317496.1 aminodeoxychorismate/anthranilate synthase component II [Lachnospiraceae bacterium]